MKITLVHTNSIKGTKSKKIVCAIVCSPQVNKVSSSPQNLKGRHVTTNILKVIEHR